MGYILYVFTASLSPSQVLPIHKQRHFPYNRLSLLFISSIRFLCYCLLSDSNLCQFCLYIDLSFPFILLFSHFCHFPFFCSFPFECFYPKIIFLVRAFFTVLRTISKACSIVMSHDDFSAQDITIVKQPDGSVVNWQPLELSHFHFEGFE